jgi:hypothetical protein
MKEGNKGEVFDRMGRIYRMVESQKMNTRWLVPERNLWYKATWVD